MTIIASIQKQFPVKKKKIRIPIETSGEDPPASVMRRAEESGIRALKEAKATDYRNPSLRPFFILEFMKWGSILFVLFIFVRFTIWIITSGVEKVASYFPVQ